MSTKRVAKVAQKTKYQQAIYSRCKNEIHRPSPKLNNGWTNIYTPKFQFFWDELYGHGNVPSKRSSEQIINHTRKNPKMQIKRAVTAEMKPTKSIAEKILANMSQSLQFGKCNLQNFKDEKKGIASDIVSFWFTIAFQIDRKDKYFLYFNYLKDQTTKWDPNQQDEIYHSHKIQITCDFDYVQKNKIINSEKNLGLPTDLLIEVFKFLKPTKMLALYSYDVEIDSRSLDKTNFNFSNMDWICNFFGLNTNILRKMLRRVVRFSYFEQVQNYIEKEKTYDRNWKEWQAAQQELDILYVHDNMKEKTTRVN